MVESEPANGAMTANEADSTDILQALATLLESRKSADPGSSYVAGLYAQGLNAILKKLGEEATETVLAARDGNPEQLIHETADLWFHSLPMLAYRGLGPDAVLEELRCRFGVSGLAEKAGRIKHP